MTGPDQPTAIDATIDEVARAMTRDRVPDLREGVARGLAHRRARVAWWQPALAAAAVLIVAVALWRIAGTDAPMEHPTPATVDAPRAPISAAAVPAPKIPPSVRRTMPAIGRRLRPPRTSDVDLAAAIPALPPVAVAPLRIEAMVTEPPAETEVEWFTPLVVETISVEPLPRSNQ